MVNFLKKLALSAMVFTALSYSALAQGREITIIFKDGSQKGGELLSVRDSVISTLKNSVQEDEEIASHPEMVEIAFIKDIDKIIMHELNVKGAGKGALIGAGVGIVVGLASESSTTSYDYNGNSVTTTRSPGSYIGSGVLGGLAGAFYGMLIGWGVATIMSEDEETVRPSLTKGFKNMREYARFEEREPRYVRDIIDNLLKVKP